MITPPRESIAGETDRRQLVQSLALTTWDLQRTGKAQEPPPRRRIIQLRAYQRLQSLYEAERGVAAEHRSVIRVSDGAKPGVLLIHGLGGSPADYRALIDLLHGEGLSVVAPLVSGHGPGHDPADILWRASLNDVHQRFLLLRQICRRVYVVGHGFGASLALHLAGRESVTGLALLAPAIIPRVSLSQRLLLRLGLRRLAWLRRRVGWGPDLLEAMEKSRGLIAKVECPIYAAQCDDDEQISADSLRFIQRRATHAASRFRVFPAGGHDILRSHAGDDLLTEIRDFIVRRR